jgi:hypothetical protein
LTITRDKIKELEWFLNFSYLNLDALSKGDKAKMALEAEGRLFPSKAEIKELITPDPVWPITPADTQEMGWVKDLPKKSSREFWKTLREAQIVVKDMFDCLPGEFRPARWKGKAVFEYAQDKDRTFRLIIQPVTLSIEKWIEAKFYQLVDGIPASFIRSCLACGKVFLNYSKKEKHCCSQKCSVKHSIQKRKEADPITFNKRQADLMRKRYKDQRPWKKIIHWGKYRGEDS